MGGALKEKLNLELPARNASRVGYQLDLLLGGVLVLSGAAVAMMANSQLLAQLGQSPRTIVVVGVSTLVAGFCMAGLSPFERWHEAAQRRRLAAHPDQPWLADHGWNREYATDDLGRIAVKQLLFLPVLAAFLVPFHYAALHMARWMWVPVVLFDALLLWAAGAAVYGLVRRLKHGRSKLLFESFPYPLEGPFKAQWVPARSIRGCRSLRFELRCVQVHDMQRGRGQHRQRWRQAFAQWRERYTVDQPGPIAAGQPVPVTFLIPEGAGASTRMSQDPPLYWELEIHADTPGVDYKALFLVPVYGSVEKVTAAVRA